VLIPFYEDVTSTLTRKLARGTAVNLSGVLIRVVLVFLHSWATVRFFGAKAYGLYVESITTVILLSTIAQIGLGRSMTRFVAVYGAQSSVIGVRKTLKIALGTAMPVALLGGGVLILSAQRIADLFHEPSLGLWFRYLGLAVPLLAFATLLGAFTQGFQKMRHRTIALDMLAPAVELLGLMLLVGLGFGWLALPFAYLISLIFASLLLIVFSRQNLRSLAVTLPQEPMDGSEVRFQSILGFSIQVWFAELLMAATARASVIMLGVFATSAAVGVFGVTQRLVGLGGVFLLSINFMAGPSVADVVERKQYDELARLHKISTRWILGVSLPLLLSIAFFGDGILRLYGDAFVGGYAALCVLISGVILDLSTGTSGTILIMSGHPKYNMLNELIRLIVIVTLSFVLIPKYGVLGVAIPIAIGTAIFSVMQVVEIHCHLRIHPFGCSFLKIVIAGSFMSIGSHVWRWLFIQENSTWVVYFMGCMSGLVIYVLVVMALGFEASEVDLLRSVRQRIMRPTKGIF